VLIRCGHFLDLAGARNDHPAVFLLSLVAQRPPPLRGILSNAMSNVETAQRFVDHWNETGEPPWDEIDPDVVFVIDPDSFVAGTYRGHKGIRTLLRLTAEVFDQFRYEVDEFVDLGESILALGRIRVRGAQSGATGTQSGAWVMQMRDGMIVSYRSYLRREEALEAAGLREELGRQHSKHVPPPDPDQFRGPAV
jgi:ketosteroid isomerase-like protein